MHSGQTIVYTQKGNVVIVVLCPYHHMHPPAHVVYEEKVGPET